MKPLFICILLILLMSADIKIFLSIYENKIDDKKRVSVPVQFRSIIEEKGDSIIYTYPSLKNQCLEVCTPQRISELESHIESFDIFSEERDILATSILGACEPMQIDAKGRISISDRLLDFARIDKEIVFVGKGKIFEIWNKQDFNNYFNYARSHVRDSSLFTNKLKNNEAKL